MQKILGNYRPISIIPTFAKIIETHVKSHLLKYLEDHSLLSKVQFAYLSGSSTETALHNIVDNILMNLDKGNITALCLLDLTKGFDTVSHAILIHKLKKYGTTGNALNWFTSYLSNRVQFVIYNNSISQSKHIYIRIPQGTILGPILFLLCINDFKKFK